MDSIDIFDTAIYRDVYKPVDIFQLVEDVLGNNFKQRRIEAENKAWKLGNPTIEDIYKYLREDMNVEINMEMDHVYPNTKILKMYNENPDNYVFISDMYLPTCILKRMLEKCGYKNPRVFVSCEEKCNKASGLLFKAVEKKIGKINKHYGDNYKSDIEGAVRCNITPVFEAALHKRDLNLPMVKNPMLLKYCAELKLEKDPLTKLAKWYAPLIYEFTKWVLNNRTNETIYFVSRDMFMPYVIAKMFLNEQNIEYLHCSRRSLSPLFLASNDKVLKDKADIVLKEDEKRQDVRPALNYLRSMGIKNNDIICDIGYTGCTQKVIEKFLDIKLQGMYMQTEQFPKFKDLNMKMFLKRFAITYRFLAEFVLTSPEDHTEDYKDNKVVTKPDNETRKELAKKINSIILDAKLFNRINKMNIDLFDLEQMLIHIQQYPDNNMLDLFNLPILTNRETMERCINFDKEKILNGGLLDCYNKSYAKPLFKKMLEMDEDLSSLIKLLPTK